MKYHENYSLVRKVYKRWNFSNVERCYPLHSPSVVNQNQKFLINLFSVGGVGDGSTKMII